MTRPSVEAHSSRYQFSTLELLGWVTISASAVASASLRDWRGIFASVVWYLLLSVMAGFRPADSCGNLTGGRDRKGMHPIDLIFAVLSGGFGVFCSVTVVFMSMLSGDGASAIVPGILFAIIGPAFFAMVAIMSGRCVSGGWSIVFCVLLGYLLPFCIRVAAGAGKLVDSGLILAWVTNAVVGLFVGIGIASQVRFGEKSRIWAGRLCVTSAALSSIAWFWYGTNDEELQIIGLSVVFGGSILGAIVGAEPIESPSVARVLSSARGRILVLGASLALAPIVWILTSTLMPKSKEWPLTASLRSSGQRALVAFAHETLVAVSANRNIGTLMGWKRANGGYEICLNLEVPFEPHIVRTSPMEPNVILLAGEKGQKTGLEWRTRAVIQRINLLDASMVTASFPEAVHVFDFYTDGKTLTAETVKSDGNVGSVTLRVSDLSRVSSHRIQSRTPRNSTLDQSPSFRELLLKKHCVAFSADTTLGVIGGSWKSGIRDTNFGAVVAYELASNEVVHAHRFSSQDSGVCSVAFSSDVESLAVGLDDGTVVVFNVNHGEFDRLDHNVFEELQ